jgi:creatinine amidohydrolase
MSNALLTATLGAALLVTATASAQDTGAYLGELSWIEAEERLDSSPIVIIPFGAGAKEHGPHLPMNADQIVMEYLCDRAVEHMSVLIAPPILHGWMPAFREYPGTSILDADLFTRYALEIAQVLVRHGARRIVFLNTGIDRATGLPLSIAAREIRAELKVPALVVSWDDLESEELAAMEEQRVGGHGGELETSIHLYLQPDLVHMDRAVVDYRDDQSAKTYAGYQPGLFSRERGDPAYSETGLFGDPTLATADKGRRALEIMTRNWLAALDGFAAVPLPVRPQDP